MIEYVLFGLGVYLLAGLLFAATFVFRGVQAIDPAARETSLGFRLLIWPGIAAFWPLMARRWVSQPVPVETNAHRRRVSS